MLGYFIINGILMEEPMSVVFQVGANGVRLLDPGSEANNLAHELYSRRAPSINVCACFNQKLLLMLLRMSHLHLQKSKRRGFKNWLLSENIRECRTRKLSHRQRQLGLIIR
ncbi:uncharacterized protein LOC120265088 [Dioscorea cayenensis subsp. rotundata]|uniref:Uncharacterized protein LOC120265088 n=1 Tax=Dioscorea cayennensis subsp. rotundata TaxID=55577 RepID=A0AB40BNB5_DIOCR|nr:uncharacterized protein LOC120265088 [Dioscorea cayenensis subsp. rotundata]